MGLKKKVDVRIGGKDYTLVGVESEDYIQKVAMYIDKKMSEIMKHNSKLSTSMTAVLTAVNVADDFFKSRQNESFLSGELKNVQNELEALKRKVENISEENELLNEKNMALQFELIKRETELNEARNSLDKAPRPKVYVAK